MEQFIVTFPDTSGVLRMEKTAHGSGLPGRIIPVPRKLQTGCGLAWAAPVNAEMSIRNALERYGIPFEKAVVMDLGIRRSDHGQRRTNTSIPVKTTKTGGTNPCF